MLLTIWGDKASNSKTKLYLMYIAVKQSADIDGIFFQDKELGPWGAGLGPPPLAAVLIYPSQVMVAK